MRIEVVNQINAKALLQESGVGDGGEKLQAMLIDECVKEMDPYVPMDTGTLKNTRLIEADGVIYRGPYAHYQYVGLVMGPNVLTEDGWRSMAPKGGKHYTGRPLTYHGAPMRGPRWDVRMWADKGPDICRRLAGKVGGKAE